MIPPSVNIGPLTFHLYGAIIAIAIYIGYQLARIRAHLYKIPKHIFDDPLFILPFILSLIGARIYHVVDYWDFYRQNISQILKVSAGGLGIWGGLAGVFLGFWIFSKVKKINLLSLLDLLSPSILLAQAIGRIGNWINQEGFGPPTNLPWGVYINPENRPARFIDFSRFHPTFFYEAILDLIFFGVLILLSKRLTSRGQLSIVRGQLFAFYLIFYSIGRFIAEFWRIDTATVGTIKLAHVLSVLTMIAGLILLIKGGSMQSKS